MSEDVSDRELTRESLLARGGVALAGSLVGAAALAERSSAGAAALPVKNDFLVHDGTSFSPLTMGIFNVRNYGALGDGTNDDTTAIANALAAIGNGAVVLFPPGTYMTNAQSVQANTHLVGSGLGSVIKLRNAQNSTLLTLSAGSGLIDLVIDGNTSGQASGTSPAVYSTSANIQVRDCLLRNARGYGLSLGAGATSYKLRGVRYSGNVLGTVTAVSGATPLVEAQKTVTVTSAYTVGVLETIILADAASAAFTVTLPAVVAERRLTVKRTNTNGNTVTIQRAGTALIDGQTSFALATPYDSVTLVSDGTNWFAV